jgi:arylsulfatase A-like enzyme
VIFTSDNGPWLNFGNHAGSSGGFREGKQTTWEGGQRVPCIFHWPEKIKAGQVSAEITRSIDFMPTFSRLASVSSSPDQPIDGLDFSDYLLGASKEFPNDRFSYYRWHDLEAVRVGAWKLHFSKYEQEHRIPISELYNLEEDPSETDNVYEKHPDIVAKLDAYAQEQRERLGDHLTDSKGSEVRKIGRITNPKTLTDYDPSHPYMIALYDLPDMPTLSG